MATSYSFTFRGPHVIEIGVTGSIEALVYSGATAVTPSDGTVSVFLADGTTLVNDETTTGTYEIADSVSAGQSPSSAAWARWAFTIAGATVRATNKVVLTPYVLRNPVNNAALLVRQPTWGAYPAGKTSWQDQLDAVWADTLNRLLVEGYEPHRIRSPYGLSEYLICRTLAVIGQASATYVDDRQAIFDKAGLYMEQAEIEWGRKRLDLDTDDDGSPDLNHAGPPNPSADMSALRKLWFGA